MAFDDKIEVSHKENIIKAQVKVTKQLFPKLGVATDNDFKILSVEPVHIEQGKVETSHWGTFIIKGNAPTIDFKDTYTVIAREEHDEKFGQQYAITYIGTPMDFSDTAIQKVFMKKILTDRQYDSMYDTLDNPFEAIKNENVPEITKCHGIGTKTALRLIEKYKQSIDFSEAYVKLDDYGLTPRMIEKLIETYGSPNIAVQKVITNPYILATEVEGIGFKRADEIALNSGIEPNSAFRIDAFMESYLREQALNGQSYMHPSELFGQLFEILSLERNVENNETVKNVLYDKYERNQIWYNEDRSRISSRYIYELEKKVAKEILRVNNAEANFRYGNWERVIKRMEESQGWRFTIEQWEGVKSALDNQIVVITGLAGSGKSTVVTGMLEVLHKSNGHSFGQCALSGRAGARLAEVTGEEGHTIHRLLGYNPHSGFEFNGDNPLPYDIVILDEVSMVGLDVFYHLVSAIKDGGKLVCLGDINQLESIGVGNLALDMINSGVLSVTTLTEIHRQARKSAIITKSANIKDGVQITEKNFVGRRIEGELKDLEIDIYNDKDMTANKVIEHFVERLPTIKNIMELQVIVPMRQRGDTSTFELNNRIQEICNPASKDRNELSVSLSKDKKYILREGDKVMNTKNNYKACCPEGENIPVYNGDLGIIREIDHTDGNLVVEFQRIGDIVISKESLRQVELAYAITTHKSQGDEINTVIVGLDYSSYVLLTKELVYTAITRASELCILVAENTALHHAINTSNVSTKKTFLKEFLQKSLTS